MGVAEGCGEAVIEAVGKTWWVTCTRAVGNAPGTAGADWQPASRMPSKTRLRASSRGIGIRACEPSSVCASHVRKMPDQTEWPGWLENIKDL